MHHVKVYLFYYSNHYYYQIMIINFFYKSIWYYLQYNKVMIYDKYINKVIISLFGLVEWHDSYYWYVSSHNHKATFEEFYAQVRK